MFGGLVYSLQLYCHFLYLKQCQLVLKVKLLMGLFSHQPLAVILFIDIGNCSCLHMGSPAAFIFCSYLMALMFNAERERVLK